MAYQAAELRGWLQAESLLNLCRLADQHGVSIDTCETKAAVVEVLLAAGEEVRGPSAAPRPAEMDVVDEEPEVKASKSCERFPCAFLGNVVACGEIEHWTNANVGHGRS